MTLDTIPIILGTILFIIAFIKSDKFVMTGSVVCYVIVALLFFGSIVLDEKPIIKEEISLLSTSRSRNSIKSEIPLCVKTTSKIYYWSVLRTYESHTIVDSKECDRR